MTNESAPERVAEILATAQKTLTETIVEAKIEALKSIISLIEDEIADLEAPKPIA